MTARPKPPAKRVYQRHGRWYYVMPGTDKWVGLTRVKAGLPALYAALADLLRTGIEGELMPQVIARWVQSKMTAGDWGDGNKENMDRVVAELSRRMVKLHPRDLTTPLAAKYLLPLLDRPRTYNMHRSVLRMVLSYAALEGLREGHNPVDDVPTAKMKKRIRIVTNADIASLKVELRKARRGGETHCRICDTMHETGQRIGDVIAIKVKQLTELGIEFDQEKTDEPLLVEWSPPLRAAIDGALAGRGDVEPEDYVFVKSTGAPYRYAGIRSAWDRACAAAGIANLHRHDIRGRAAVDTVAKRGLKAAQDLLGHRSVTMTEGYIQGKMRRVSKAVSASNEPSESRTTVDAAEAIELDESAVEPHES